MPDNCSVTEAEREATFQLINDVEIYGGFAGTEDQRDQRDWLTHITVLSGDIDNNDTTDANGVVVDADDIAGSDTDATAILDGFVITAGLADGEFDSCGPACGGGMYNISGSPTLAHLRFSGNRARQRRRRDGERRPFPWFQSSHPQHHLLGQPGQQWHRYSHRFHLEWE